MEESGSPSSALTQHQHETEGFSESGSEQQSGQSSASTIATLAEYNPSTSKGHEILSQVYQQSQVQFSPCRWYVHMLFRGKVILTDEKSHYFEVCAYVSAR